MLRHSNPKITEIAALLTGSKKVLFTTYDASNWDYMMDLCRHFDLEYFLPESSPHEVQEASKTIFLGKDQKMLRRAAILWGRDVMGVDWGLSLGYPLCCVKFYVSRKLPWSQEGAKRIIPPIADHTRSKSPFPFVLNNVFNFFSRLSANNPHYHRMAELNVQKQVDISSLHVIFWHPCSYDCAESLRRAAEIWSFLERHVPALGPLLSHFLRRPVLYIDSFELAVFDGEIGPGGELSYRSVLEPPYGLLPEKIAGPLRSGNRLRIESGDLIIRRNDKELARIKEPRAALLDFSLAPR